MSKNISFFSPRLLDNYNDLKSYLKGKDTILFLEKNTNQIQLPKNNALYFGRWKIAWIICKIPFEYLLSLFFSAISKITYTVKLTRASQFFCVLSKQMIRDFEQFSCQNNFEKQLIVPAFNVPQISAFDVYMRLPFPINSLKDEKIISLTQNHFFLNEGIKDGMKSFFLKLEHLIFKQNAKNSYISSKEKKEVTNCFKQLVVTEGLEAGMKMLEKKYPYPKMHQVLSFLYNCIKAYESYRKTDHISIPFDSPLGVCRGATTWFVYLFVSTQHLFKEPKKHLIAIAELFRSGVPSQGCLLQGLINVEENILGLKTQLIKEASSTCFEMDIHEKKEMQKKLQKLDPGVYFLKVRRHAFAYIKISENEGYMWNANSGLIDLEGSIQSGRLLDYILQNHYIKGDISSEISVLKFSLQSENDKLNIA